MATFEKDTQEIESGELKSSGIQLSEIINWTFTYVVIKINFNSTFSASFYSNSRNSSVFGFRSTFIATPYQSSIFI